MFLIIHSYCFIGNEFVGKVAFITLNISELRQSHLLADHVTEIDQTGFNSKGVS